MTRITSGRIVPGMALKVTSLRWSPETFSRLKVLAAKRNMTVSDLIRCAVIKEYPEPQNGKAARDGAALSQTEGVTQ